MAHDLQLLIVALSRIQSDLRAIHGSLYAYPEDPQAEQVIVTLIMTLEARVRLWMRHDEHDRRAVERRQIATRRQQERRHDLELPATVP